MFVFGLKCPENVFLSIQLSVIFNIGSSNGLAYNRKRAIALTNVGQYACSHMSQYLYLCNVDVNHSTISLIFMETNEGTEPFC